MLPKHELRRRAENWRPRLQPVAPQVTATLHSIEAIEGDGKIIKLDDGSMWEVDDVDTVTTSIWLAASEAVVCRGRMINSDDDESVGVIPVSRVGSATKTSSSRPNYVVQAAANDETFVIK